MKYNTVIKPLNRIYIKIYVQIGSLKIVDLFCVGWNFAV